MEALVCLAIAVILFRAFEVEGYMISSGSMAPFLLGYHKRVGCPVCGHRFPLGITEQEAQAAMAAPPADKRRSRRRGLTAECPNCGLNSLSVDHVPVVQGDQLLVHKHAYLFHPPRRWEVIVFRNPQKPSQAYVKRVVGLPGERLQIVNGDIYANGRLRRKNFATIQAMRMLVYDHDHQPKDDPEWHPRWTSDASGTGWKPQGSGFDFAGVAVHTGESEELNESGTRKAESRAPQSVHARNPQSTIRNPQSSVSWVSYRHWLRAGGRHATSVPIEWSTPFDDWPEVNREAHAAASDPTGRIPPVRYDASTRQLICTGVLTDEWRTRLLDRADDSRHVAAVRRLAEQSHFAPITPMHGYNRSRRFDSRQPVRDLMIAVKVRLGSDRGKFILRMTDGRETFDCVLDVAGREIRLHKTGHDRPLRSARWPITDDPTAVLLEMSLFDSQVIVAADGKPVFDPWEYTRPPETRSELLLRPVQFGAVDGRVSVDSLQLFCDIYYTSGKGRNAVREPFPVGRGEFFVLGDNSPVSSDSRGWPHAGVQANLLVGKPFLLHLPSRPGKVKIGGREAYIRIPDFARIRYIH